MIQELVILPARPGVTKEKAQEILDIGQNLGEDYLKVMRKNKIYGDVSFLLELEGRVYLASYYLSEGKLSHSTEINWDNIKNEKLREYFQIAEPYFDVSQRSVVSVANSFWIDSVIKEQLK